MLRPPSTHFTIAIIDKDAVNLQLKAQIPSSLGLGPGALFRGFELGKTDGLLVLAHANHNCVGIRCEQSPKMTSWLGQEGTPPGAIDRLEKIGWPAAPSGGRGIIQESVAGTDVGPRRIIVCRVLSKALSRIRLFRELEERAFTERIQGTPGMLREWADELEDESQGRL